MLFYCTATILSHRPSPIYYHHQSPTTTTTASLAPSPMTLPPSLDLPHFPQHFRTLQWAQTHPITLFGLQVCICLLIIFFLKFASSAPSPTTLPPSLDHPPSNNTSGTLKWAQTMSNNVVWGHSMFFFLVSFLLKFASSAPSAMTLPPSPDLPPSNDALGTSKQAQTMS